MKYSEGLLFYEDGDYLDSPEKAIVRTLQGETRRIYSKLCSEFGLYPPKPLIIGIFEDYVQSVAGTCSHYKHVDYIGYNLSVAKVIFDRIYDQTIPHEVAHSFQYQLYPKSDAHGKDWEEIMKYLRVPPLVFNHMSVEIGEKVKALNSPVIELWEEIHGKREMEVLKAI